MRMHVKRGFLSRFDLFHDITCNGRSGGEGFDMSALPASANRSIRIDGQMTQFCPHPAETLKQTATRDHSSTNPSADGEVDNVLMSFACAKLPLGKPCHIGIVIEVGGYTEMFRQF